MYLVSSQNRKIHMFRNQQAHGTFTKVCRITSELKIFNLNIILQPETGNACTRAHTHAHTHTLARAYARAHTVGIVTDTHNSELLLTRTHRYDPGLLRKSSTTLKAVYHLISFKLCVQGHLHVLSADLDYIPVQKVKPVGVCKSFKFHFVNCITN